MMRTKPRRATALAVVVLTFFLSQMCACYLSHSLALLMNAYQTLFNWMTLVLIVISQRIASRRTSLRNTFGWARTEVVGTLVSILFLFALCFAITTTAIQTLLHAGHEETAPHHPIILLMFGIVGLTLDVFCYLIIWDPDNTRHPGTFITVRGNNVQVNFVEAGHGSSSKPCDSHVKERRRQLSEGEEGLEKVPERKKPSLLSEALRTSGSSIIVIICACVLLFVEGHWVVLYIDACLALLAVTIIVFTFYPYVRDSGLILLQTVPHDVDLEKLQRRMLRRFPDLLNLHDLHIWTLNNDQCIATIHITLQRCEQAEYEKLAADIEEFFANNGIDSVTIQPEFYESGQEPGGAVRCAFKCGACTLTTCCIGEALEKDAEVFASRKRVGSHESLIISPSLSGLNNARETDL